MSFSRPISSIILASACFFLTVSSARAQERDSALRVLDSALAASLHEGYAASPTMRALVDELERSDLIIHIVGMPWDRRRLDGAMQFVVAAGDRRYLRISVNGELSPERRAATIGHELQHAVEVARSSLVADRDSLGALYRQIGEESAGIADLECYETDGARRAGERVLSELRAAHATAGNTTARNSRARRSR